MIQIFEHAINLLTCVDTIRHTMYFLNSEQKGKTCYTEEQVISILECLIDNIFAEFGDRLFQLIVSVPMELNCGPIFADFFLFSDETDSLRHF